MHQLSAKELINFPAAVGGSRMLPVQRLLLFCLLTALQRAVLGGPNLLLKYQVSSCGKTMVLEFPPAFTS